MAFGIAKASNPPRPELDRHLDEKKSPNPHVHDNAMENPQRGLLSLPNLDRTLIKAVSSGRKGPGLGCV